MSCVNSDILLTFYQFCHYIITSIFLLLPMSTLADTSRLIRHALNQSLRLVESDTEVSTIDVNLLGNLNTNQSLNYIKLEQHLNSLEVDSKKLLVLEEELVLLVNDLDHIEKQVDTLREVAGELDQWSKEIEQRVRK